MKEENRKLRDEWANQKFDKEPRYDKRVELRVCGTEVGVNT